MNLEQFQICIDTMNMVFKNNEMNCKYYIQEDMLKFVFTFGDDYRSIEVIHAWPGNTFNYDKAMSALNGDMVYQLSHKLWQTRVREQALREKYEN